MKKVVYQVFLIIFFFINLGVKNADAVVSEPSEHATYPDLFIESVEFWGDEGTDWTPKVKIKNVGDASLTPSSGRIFVRLKYMPTGGQEPQNWTAAASLTATINPGETLELNDELMSGIHGEIQEGGTYIAEVSLEKVQNGAYVLVSWENRGNNRKTGSIPPQPFSDLIISEVFFPNANTRPIIRIKNIGEARFANSNFLYANVKIKYLDNNGQVPEGAPLWHSSGQAKGYLSPGGEAEIKLDGGFYSGFPANSTNYVAEIEIKIQNTSASVARYMRRERSENNQAMGQLPTLMRTDLIIEDIFFPARDAYPVVRIRNVGQARFYNSAKINVDAKLKLPGTTWLMFASSTQSLNSGEVVDILFNRKPDSFSSGLPEGSDYTAALEISLKSVVGASDHILNYIDEDGSNNEKTGKVTYRPIPDPSESATSTEEIVNKTNQAKTIKYPIKELGNCKDKDDCKRFCDIKKNTKKCLNWAKDNELMTEEETVVAEEIIETTNGPGNCTTKESCAEFCEKPVNIDACLSYAEKNNWMSADDLSKARKVVSVLKQEGSKTPGGCNTPGACKNYCSDNSHAVECVAFGKLSGLLTVEEAAEAEKIAPLMQQGRMPGNKKTREETEAYCDKKENRLECDKFFEEAGVKKGGFEKDAENAPSIFKASGNDGPGGCKTKAECDAYCDSHPGECDEAVLEAGGEVKEITVPCSTNEECRKFCADSANAEACKNIVIEESPEEAEASKPEVIKEEIEKLRQNILEMPLQSHECLKQVWGQESFDRVMAGQTPETPVKAEDLQSCYSQGVKLRDETEMQNKPKPEGEGDEDDIKPSSSKIQGFSFFLASIEKFLINWIVR